MMDLCCVLVVSNQVSNVGVLDMVILVIASWVSPVLHLRRWPLGGLHVSIARAYCAARATCRIERLSHLIGPVILDAPRSSEFLLSETTEDHLSKCSDTNARW